MRTRGTEPFFSITAASGLRRCRPNWAAAAALVAAAAGCGPGARIGPMREFASSAEDLTLSVAERMRAIKTLHDPDATIGSGGLHARAEIFLKDRRLFRAEISHAAAGEIARAVLNEDGVLFVNWRQKKAFTGNIKTLLETRLADTGLSPDHFVVRKLFFPDLEPVSGERAVLTYGKTTYTVEFWRHGRLWPVRSVTVDDWSHAPLSAVFYTADGRVAADIRWRRFKYLGEHRGKLDCVVATEVLVRLPMAGHAYLFTLGDPGYNKEMRRKAFRLRVPRGVELEETESEGQREGAPVEPR